MGLKEKDILKRVLFYGGNAIVALIFVSPLLWMIAASLKPEAQIFSDMSNIRTFWPTAATLGNYVEVFTRVNMMKFILNSLFYVFVIVILDLAVNSVCGYALAKFDFPGKELLLTVVISLMVLPMEAIMLPISGTVYATIFILDFVAHWNDFMWPMLVVTGEGHEDNPAGHPDVFGSKPIHYGAIMASLTISAIPMLLMFVFLQKYYVEGIASTGIKG